jgi:hypothetical protein
MNNPANSKMRVILLLIVFLAIIALQSVALRESFLATGAIVQLNASSTAPTMWSEVPVFSN